MSDGRRLVSVVLDGPPTPAWQARALQRLRESDRLSIRDVRLQPAPRRSALSRAHAAAERRLLYLAHDPLAPVGVASEPPAADADPAQLTVWLSERTPPADAARALIYLRHARRVEPAEDAVRRAVLQRATCIESEAILQSADGGLTLVDSTISELRPFSATLTAELMLWKLADVVARAAERTPGRAQPAPSAVAPRQAPAAARLYARSVVAWPRMLAVKLVFRRPWAIRIRRRQAVATEGWSEPAQSVRWARGHLYADPFLFEHEGRHHLFCEDVPPGSARGVISHTELNRDGSPAAAPRPVVERPHHLSYPFVFVHKGELMMIPGATAMTKGVELYRALAFPASWQREAVLLETIAPADVTLLCGGDRLWMFATVAAEHASLLDELHLFWAHEPRGPWHPHPMNPVVSDARGARPAGAIQRWGARLIRPAQDCSRRYGGSISFREIDALTEERYAEHEIARLEPSDVAGARATHTYSADSRFEAIDLRRHELRLSLPLHKLAAWMTRRAGWR
jgi:hypothetical protein